MSWGRWQVTVHGGLDDCGCELPDTMLADLIADQGSRGLGINITNRTCTVYGYPGPQRLDANGQPLPTSVQRTIPAPVSFSLGPQQQATFGYFVCTKAATVEVTPPDETAHVNVKSTFDECDPQGNVSVGALRPGKLTAAQYLSL